MGNLNVLHGYGKFVVKATFDNFLTENMVGVKKFDKPLIQYYLATKKLVLQEQASFFPMF